MGVFLFLMSKEIVICIVGILESVFVAPNK